MAALNLFRKSVTTGENHCRHNKRISLNDLLEANNLGCELYRHGNIEHAHEMLIKAYGISKQHLGEDHCYTLTIEYNLGNVLIQAKRFGSGLTMLKHVYQKQKIILEKENSYTLTAGYIVACVLIEQGAFREASNILQEIYDMRKINLGSGHRNTLFAD